MTNHVNALRLYLAVALGAALGGGARHLCSLWILEATGPTFPWGTLLVNVLGALVIGYYAALPLNRWYSGETTHLFMTAGVCGGFTTFSVFSLELFRLFHGAFWLAAASYLVLSMTLWLTAVVIGYRLARRIIGFHAN